VTNSSVIKNKILERRNHPPEVQVHKLFSRGNIPAGDILEGYVISEEEFKEIVRPGNSGRETELKEVRIEEEGLNYQAMGRQVEQYLRDYSQGAEKPFRYCFYRSSDADNCASLIYKLLEFGGATQYAKLKKEWEHITPKNVFAFGKAVEVALSKLALAKVQMQTQADYIASVTGILHANFASTFGKDVSDVTEFKTALDAGKSLVIPSLDELKTENITDRLAFIIKQLYLFSHLLKNSPGSDHKKLNENVISYLKSALEALDQIKRDYTEKTEFFELLIKLIEELQKSLSDEHRLFPLDESRGLARIEVENALKDLTKKSPNEQYSLMYSTLQTHQKAGERLNIPAPQMADDHVFAAIIAPTGEDRATDKPQQRNMDEYDRQISHVVDFINTNIHTNPDLLGDEETTAKYQRIMQLLQYFKVIQEITPKGKHDLRKELFAAAMNVSSALLQIRRLKEMPIDGVPNSFYELLIKQMQTVFGTINRLIYFDLERVKDPYHSNLDLTAELSVLLDGDAAPLNVDEVLTQAEKRLRSQLPADKPASVHAETMKEVSIPQRHGSDYFKFWDYDSNWYAEVATRRSVAIILKAEKLSRKQQLQKARSIIADAKPSVLKFWRWAEYDRYTALERQVERICITKSFLQGESDEVGLIQTC